MTHAQLIAAMLATARPVIEQYWTDVAHDARTIANAECGDAFLWAPYSHGSRLVCLWRGDKPNRMAAELMEGMQKAGPQPPQWFRVSIGAEDSFGLDPIAPEAGAAECRSATETSFTPGRAHVAQMHL